MQPVPDKVNVDDSESLFDFLDANDDEPASDRGSAGRQHQDGGRPGKIKSVSHASRTASEEKPFPVIRKPVCVTQTGALRPPRPGDPVEPPPPLTDGVRVAPVPAKRPERAEIDLSDLDDLNLDLGEDDWPGSDQWVDQTHRPVPTNYEDQGTSWWRKIGYGVAGLLIVSGAIAAIYSLPSVKSWVASVTESVVGASTEGDTLANNEVSQNTNVLTPVDADAPKTLATMFREELSSLETMLGQGDLDGAELRLQTMDRAVYGYGAPEFSDIKERIAALRQGGSNDDAQVRETQLLEQQQADQARALEQQRVAEELELQRQAEAERQAAQALAAEQERAAQEAERLAAERAVQERETAEAQRLAAEQAEAQRAAEAERVAEEQRAAEAARVAEAQRAAEAERVAEAQRAAEAERVAEAQRAAEAERVAEAQRAAEAERVAEEQRAAEEAWRLELQRQERAREIAAQEQIRSDRIAQEEARLEQLELARQQRDQLDQERIQQQSAEQAAAAAAYQAETDQALTPQTQSESIQDIAASQREAARQQRLIDARARSAQADSVAQDSPAQSESELVVARVEPPLTQSIEPVQPSAPQSITDADLQLVYGQFAQLQSAIEDRDVNAVIRLTERSGARIQQVMQMFENNVSIQTQLRNVSTLDARGEIQGTLRITRLVRADGSVTGPPLNLGSVRLSSVRKGDGWSSIRW